MTKFLLSIFVKNKSDSSLQEVRAKIGRLSGMVGVICNLLVVAMKMTLGFLTGAFSVIADAMNNLSDAASAIVTLIGFKLAEKPADKDHPYGHARYEYLSGLAVAAMILLIGVELLKTSVDKIIHPVAIAYTFPLYVVLVVSVLVKFWMYLFNRKLGKMIASSALFATAIDSRNDAITTVAILLSAIVAVLTDLNIDGYVSLGLSAFIMYSGVQLARQTISPLLGESASPRLREDILSVLEGEPKVLGYHDLMIHDYGPGQRFGSLHIEMDCREDPMACHDIIDNMERICLERYNIHLVIHYDPIVTDDGELSRLRETVTQILRTLDSRISIHDFRMVRGNDHTNLIFDMVLPSELMQKRFEIKEALDKVLAELDGNTYYTVVEYDMEGFN
ncbi:MAG: cation transporter [Ruminococcaceae bacterium]|nr:cation transporter [Oscillospiraceae bacterium]